MQLGAWYSRIDAAGTHWFDDNFLHPTMLVPAAQAGPLGSAAVDVSLEFEMVLSKRAAINGRRNLF